SMRRLLAALALALTATTATTATTAAAQAVFGTYSLATAQGGTITITLTRASGGAIGGTLTGNGMTPTVAAAAVQGRDVRGTFSFHGGSTYTGGSYGSSNSSRTVFSPNGVVSQNASGENVNTGAPGNVYGQGTSGQSGRWKVQLGQLWLSADGVQWAPQRLKV